MNFIERLIHQTHRRWLLPVVGLLAVLTLMALGPGIGFSKNVVGTTRPLWTDRPTTVTANVAPVWVTLAKDLKPAVVNISTKRSAQTMPDLQVPLDRNDPFNQFFEPFFQNLPARPVQSLGSGFIINANGYVVTNNHVVDKATDIRVKLSDGRVFQAKVIGRDPKTDLALLKIDATGLPVIPLGDSSRLQVGEPVMAIGNPFGLEQTVTSGIVSATGRVIGEGPYDQFIQTDASINPGNSGGPLINTQGQAVGINTVIFTQSGGSVGIGFAIPVDEAKPVVTQLAETGHVVRGWLGVGIQTVSPDLAKSFHLPEASGALVASVVDHSPAAKAGVKTGDVITEYNGIRISRADGLPLAVATTPIGHAVPLTVVRDGKTLVLTVQIARLAEAAEQPTVTAAREAPLGLVVESVTPRVARELGLKDSQGAVVRSVKDASAAANAGIQPGDVIVGADRHPVKSAEDLRQDLRGHQPKTPVLLLVHRNGDSLYVAVPIA